jgi:hypothetical protein
MNFSSDGECKFLWSNLRTANIILIANLENFKINALTHPVEAISPGEEDEAE